MQKESIAFLMNDLNTVGGAERATVNLVNALIEVYDITLVSLFYFTQPSYKLDNRINTKSILSKNDAQRLRNILKLSSIKRINKILADKKAVIVVGSSSSIGLIGKFKLSKLKIIVWEHTSIDNIYSNKRKRIFLYRLAIALSDKFVYLTAYDTKKHEQKYHDKKAVHIFNGIDDDSIPKECKYNLHSKTIITLARIDRVKGLDILLKVAEKIKTDDSDWVWKIFGQIDDKEYYNELKIQLADLSSNIKIEFCKPVIKVKDELLKSSIYVMTSRHEGLPMSLIEAKACKLPIVSFDCKTGPREIINDGLNGDLIVPYDIDMMANKISELIGNKNKRKKYSENSYVNIDKFMMSNIVKKWIEIIEN